MRKPRVAIGIDLGTSKCCVGVVRDGKVEILENERGNKTTPSYVAFTDTERLVGDDAKDQATLNPANTVFGVKRLQGRKFDDPAVQELVPRLPYKLHATEQGKPLLEVEYMKQKISLYPEQVTAMLLTKMVDLVKKQLDFPVDKAVISVPASFTNAQRQATKDAAAIAGLKVLALINEPTAAAIAYEANRKEEEAETIAVVDFGGGKIEISFVLVGKGAIEVEAVHGCNRLGGLDVDSRLVELFIHKFREERGIDLKTNVKAKERLRNACEKLKHTLSLLPEARVQLDCLSGDIDFEVTVTRKELNQVLADNIIITMDQLWYKIKHSLKRKQLSIARVLLVGGSTRILAVQEWLKKTFDSINFDKTVNPDEAVAQGAAIRAALLCGHCEQTEIDVRDIILNPLYLQFDNTRRILFKRFSMLPDRLEMSVSVQSSKSVLTLWETQSSLNGDRGITLANFSLPRKPIHLIKLVGQLDDSGILVASLYLNGKEESLNDLIHNTLRLLSSDDISKLIDDEKLFRIHATAENERVTVLSNLEAYCFEQKNYLEILGKQGAVPLSLQRELEEQIEATITWVDNNPGVAKKVLDQKMRFLQEACSPLPRNSKERLSVRSASVGRHRAPAAPSFGTSDERASRRDQPRVRHDAPKARAVSQPAWRSGEGSGVPGADESRLTNGREASSRALARDSQTKGESPQMIRKAEDLSANDEYLGRRFPESSRRDSPHRQNPGHSRGQSPQRQTFKRPHSRGESPLIRQPKPHSSGQFPQERAGDPMTMQSESHNSNQFGGTDSPQPLSSTIMKGFTEYQSKQKGSNFPPSIKQPLLLKSSSRGLSSRYQSSPDNKHPVQVLDARASNKIPASGFRSQSGGQDWADSQPNSVPYQANLASTSQPYSNDSTDQFTSLSGGALGHAQTPSNDKGLPSIYSSVYQQPNNIYRNDVYRSVPRQSTIFPLTNSSSASSRLTATEESTRTLPLESATSSDHRNSRGKRLDTRSIGVQTDPPNKDDNTSKPTTSPTCNVCCQLFRCGCPPANGVSVNLGSSARKENNGEQKMLVPNTAHDRSRSASRGALTTIPSQNLTSPPYREERSDKPTSFQDQTQAPRLNIPSAAMTSHLTINSVSPHVVTPKSTSITTRLNQPTYSSTPAVTSPRTITSPSPSSHDPSKNSSERVSVHVSGMCSHGNHLDNCSYCFAKRSKEFREKVGSPLPGTEDSSKKSSGVACNCRQVSCSECHSSYNSKTHSRRGKVHDLMRRFETPL